MNTNTRGRGPAVAVIAVIAIAAVAAGVGLGWFRGAGAPEPGTITVFAASSLRNALPEIGREFEAAIPGAKVSFVFSGTQQLAEQLGAGAAADVFASANAGWMETTVAGGRIDAKAPRTFARNRLVVIYPARNPAQIESLHDLAKPGLKLVLADTGVPLGAYTLELLNKLSAAPEYGAAFGPTVLGNITSYAFSSAMIVERVAAGDADCGIVYASELADGADAKLGSIDIPFDLNVVATYRIAPLRDSANAATAQAFAQFVLSPKAQAILGRHGFAPAGATTP